MQQNSMNVPETYRLCSTSGLAKSLPAEAKTNQDQTRDTSTAPWQQHISAENKMPKEIDFDEVRQREMATDEVSTFYLYGQIIMNSSNPVGVFLSGY